MEDDFNIVEVIGYLFEMVREINIYVNFCLKEILIFVKDILKEFCSILGILE